MSRPSDIAQRALDAVVDAAKSSGLKLEVDDIAKHATTRLRLGRRMVRRALESAFPTDRQLPECRTIEEHEIVDAAASAMAAMFRPGVEFDDQGQVREYLVDLEVCGAVPGRSGEQYAMRARRLCGAPDAILRTRQGNRVHPRAFGGRGDHDIDPDVPLTDSELADRLGVTGTEFVDGVPAVEPLDKLSPYKARGLALQHGAFDRMAREIPAIADSVEQRTNYLKRATWEFETNPVLRMLDEDALAAWGVDLDEEKRIVEELNMEFAANPSIGHAGLNQMRVEMVRQGDVCGASNHEFGIDTGAEVGRRTTFIELRAMSSIETWILHSQSGKLLGITQETSGASGRATRSVVDARKLMRFSVNQEGDNFEGISKVRPTFFWQMLGNEVARGAMLHAARFGRGFPILRRSASASDASKNQSVVDAARKTVRNFYNSKHAYFDLPEGFNLEILQLKAEEGVPVLLEYCHRLARQSFGAGVFDLGQNGTGTYALSSNASQMFLASLSGFAAGPEAAHDTYIRTYCDAFHGPRVFYPVMRIRNILQRSQAETINLWSSVKELERENPDMPAAEIQAVRTDLGLPPLSEDAVAARSSGPERPSMLIAQLNAAMAITEKLSAGALGSEAARELLIAAGVPAESVDTIVEHATPDAEAPNSDPDDSGAPEANAPAADDPAADTDDDDDSEEEADDATARAAERLTGLTRALTRASTTVPPTVQPRAKRSVTVVCRGGEYVTHRELTDVEKHVDFRALDKAIDDAGKDGLEAVRKVAKDIRQEYVDRVDPYIDDAKRGDADALAAIARAEIDREAAEREVAAALTPIYKDAALFAAADLLEELEDAMGGDFEPVEQDSIFIEAAAVVVIFAAVVAKRIVTQFADALSQQAIAVAQGGNRSLLSGLEPSDGLAGNGIRSGVTAVINEAREEAAASQGPEIRRVQYSAVMDRTTCEDCGEVDEEIYVVGTQRWNQVRPPNRNCRSQLGGSNLCRCLGVYMPADVPE